MSGAKGSTRKTMMYPLLIMPIITPFLAYTTYDEVAKLFDSAFNLLTYSRKWVPVDGTCTCVCVVCVLRVVCVSIVYSHFRLIKDILDQRHFGLSRVHVNVSFLPVLPVLPWFLIFPHNVHVHHFQSSISCPLFLYIHRRSLPSSHHRTRHQRHRRPCHIHPIRNTRQQHSHDPPTTPNWRPHPPQLRSRRPPHTLKPRRRLSRKYTQTKMPRIPQTVHMSTHRWKRRGCQDKEQKNHVRIHRFRNERIHSNAQRTCHRSECRNHTTIDRTLRILRGRHSIEFPSIVEDHVVAGDLSTPALWNFVDLGRIYLFGIFVGDESGVAHIFECDAVENFVDDAHWIDIGIGGGLLWSRWAI